MLATRCHRVLSQACRDVIVVGKEVDRLPLPFLVLDDGSELRAAIVGLAAGIRLAATELCVVLPTDMPWVSAGLLRELAEACDGDAAVPQTGPLPGAYRRSALPVLERRIAHGELALLDALADLSTRVVDVDERLLGNVNTRADLESPRS
jgi:molybdopterin-guanine dinucleotide biosynthesis protein A